MYDSLLYWYIRRHVVDARSALASDNIGERAGLKQSAIARLESSAQIPRFDTLQKVAFALGLRFELVPDGEEELTDTYTRTNI